MKLFFVTYRDCNDSFRRAVVGQIGTKYAIATIALVVIRIVSSPILVTILHIHSVFLEAQVTPCISTMPLPNRVRLAVILKVTAVTLGNR